MPRRSPEPVSEHAPPLPPPTLMTQRWLDLTFLHWRVDPDVVAPLLPPGTRPDVFDGSTYVGLIPFRMVAAGIGGGPPVPWLGTFAETNVRLYSVDGTGRRGIVFLTLEASRLAVVLGARTVFGLPYPWARMSVRHVGDAVEYTTARRWPAPRGTGGRIVVRPEEVVADPDPEAVFLSARWGLHVEHLGRTWYVPNRHEPWPLHRARLLHLDDELVGLCGFPDLAARPPDSLLWSPGVRTAFGRPGLASTPRPVTG
ncbi:MAG: YqjF family protein [Actinomycetes bacterium]